MQQHREQTGRRDRRPEHPHVHVRVPEGGLGHEEDHQALVERVQHHDPEGVRLVALAEATL